MEMKEVIKAFQAGTLSLEEAAKTAHITRADFLEVLGKWPVFWISQDGLTAYKIEDIQQTLVVNGTEEDSEITTELIDALAAMLREKSWFIMDWRKLEQEQKK
jgi:hypothetical protein